MLFFQVKRTTTRRTPRPEDGGNPLANRPYGRLKIHSQGRTMTAWKAFVLMPFEDDFDPVYSQLIEPALTEVGFAVTRADLSINQQQILKDIVNQLAEADLVIVDVSGLNGNVMYELGLAHAMGRRTVMITRDIGELPFDLQSYRANGYSTEFTEAPKLKSRLTEIAKGVIDGTAQFSNPVQDFAPTFLGRPEQISHAPSKPESGDKLHGEGEPAEEELDEPGLLDFAIQLSESSEEIVTIGTVITEATEQIGTKVSGRSEEMKAITSRLGQKAAPTLRHLLRETAKDFDEFTDVLEEQNPLLRDALERMGDSANGIARSRGADSEEERAQLLAEIESLRQGEESFAGAYEGVSGFSKTMQELPSMEQTLTKAVRRAVRAVSETAETINLGRSEFARARGLLEERLSSQP